MLDPAGDRFYRSASATTQGGLSRTRRGGFVKTMGDVLGEVESKQAATGLQTPFVGGTPHMLSPSLQSPTALSPGSRPDFGLGAAASAAAAGAGGAIATAGGTAATAAVGDGVASLPPPLPTTTTSAAATAMSSAVTAPHAPPMSVDVTAVGPVGSAILQSPAGAPPMTPHALFVGADAWEVKEEDVEVIDRIGGGNFGDVFRGRLWGCEVAVKLLVAAVVTEDVRACCARCRIAVCCDSASAPVFSSHSWPGPEELQSRGCDSGAAAASKRGAVHWRVHTTPKRVHRHRVVRARWPQRHALRPVRAPVVLCTHRLCAADCQGHVLLAQVRAGTLVRECCQGSLHERGSLTRDGMLRSARQIIHRDLKSHNLLVTKDFVIKVADFGLTIARERKATSMEGEQDGSGDSGGRYGVQGACSLSWFGRCDGGHVRLWVCRCAGTPQWMAPEVMEGQSYSNRIDVYSFGIVLCELLARIVPFSGARTRGSGGESTATVLTPRVSCTVPAQMCTSASISSTPSWKRAPCLPCRSGATWASLAAVRRLLRVPRARGLAIATAPWRRRTPVTRSLTATQTVRVTARRRPRLGHRCLWPAVMRRPGGLEAGGAASASPPPALTSFELA
jgi:hypothetical protein